jgi:hypothetical protein
VAAAEGGEAAAAPGAPPPWVAAVQSATSPTLLAELEASLLEARVLYALLHPGRVAPSKRLPASLTTPGGASARRVPSDAEREEAAASLAAIEAFLPAPARAAAPGGEVGASHPPRTPSLALDALAAFGMTESTHPKLLARLRGEARAMAYAVALLLNRRRVWAPAGPAAAAAAAAAGGATETAAPSVGGASSAGTAVPPAPSRVAAPAPPSLSFAGDGRDGSAAATAVATSGDGSAVRCGVPQLAQ